MSKSTCNERNDRYAAFIYVCAIGMGVTSVWSAILTDIWPNNYHWAFQAMEFWDFPGFMLFVGSVIGFSIGHRDN